MKFIYILFGAIGYVFALDKCNHLGVHLYEDLACTPVEKTGQECPQKYNDCTFETPEYKAEECLFKGKNLPLYTEIPREQIPSPCKTQCSCRWNARISCNSEDEINCDNKTIPKASCRIGYKLGSCCPDQEICPPDSEKTCDVDGKKYKVGEKFTPKNTCLNCVCHKDFKGAFDEKTCLKKVCSTQFVSDDDIDHFMISSVSPKKAIEIETKCAAGYHVKEGETLCCPDEWICPNDGTTEAIKVMDKTIAGSSDLTCDFGTQKVKLGEGFERKTDRVMKCVCVLPPFITCWQV